MGKLEVVIDEDYRMKVVNFLKGYGYYKGVLVSLELEKKYINGEISIDDVIQNKNDYKELKLSISKALDYCYYNGFKEIANVMEYFYKVECVNIRRKFGSFFDKM